MASLGFSTLMVLLSGGDHDFTELWGKTGGFNDPSSNKHTLPLQDIIANRNFRSAIVDNWTNAQFDTIVVSGTNTYGDVLWEMGFGFTGTNKDLSSWMTTSNAKYSTHGDIANMSIIWSVSNYNVRVTTKTNTELIWFAVTSDKTTYNGMPRIFAPGKANKAFTKPTVKNGYFGCWAKSELTISGSFTDFSMTSSMCVDYCWTKGSVAYIQQSTNCFCANTNVEPVNVPSQCLDWCADFEGLCGGPSTTYGSAYHVQGPKLPGELTPIPMYNQAVSIANIITIDEAQIGSGAGPHFITNIGVDHASLSRYDVAYSAENCSSAQVNGSFLLISGTNFVTDNTMYNVSSLRVGCIRLNVSSVQVDQPINVRLNGIEGTDYVEVPVMVIQGKWTEQTTAPTTTSPTTNPPSTTISTTTTTMTTTSTTVPPTTTVSPWSAESFTTSITQTTTSVNISTYQQSTETPAQLVLSTVEIQTTTSTATCYCPCNISLSQLNMTAEELQERILQIQKRLSVNVSQLSSTIRKLTSAKDERPSAISIGSIGVLVLVLMFATIIFIDSAMLFRDLKMLYNNLRNCMCIKRRLSN